MPFAVVEPGQEPRRDGWFLGGLVLAGLVLRLFRIGTPSLWTDELFTANRYHSDLWTVIRQSDPFPPFYYIIGKLWSLVSGLSEAALRFPSAVYSVLGVVALYFLARELFDRRTARVAAVLLAFSPYSINYAQEAKMFSLFWLLGTVSFWFLCRYLRTAARRDLAVYAAVSVVSIYTFYMGFVVLVVENLIFFLLARRGRRGWLFAQLAVLAAYVPWALRLLKAIGRREEAMGWINPPESAGAFLMKLGATITGNWVVPPRPAELALYGLILVSAWISWSAARRLHLRVWTRGDVLAVLALAVPPALFLTVDAVAHHVLIVRYLGFAHIPLMLLLARAIARYAPPLRVLVAGLLIAGWTAVYLVPYYRDSLKIERQDWRGLAREIAARPAPGAVTVIDAWLVPRVRYYFPGIQPADMLDQYQGPAFYRLYKGPLFVPVDWDSPKPYIPPADLTLPGGVYHLEFWTNRNQKLSCTYYVKVP